MRSIRFQDKYKLTLLSGWGKADYVPPRGTVGPDVDMKTPPPEQVDKMDATTFFSGFAEALKDNPPNEADYPILHRLERIGLKVGDSFDLSAIPANIKQAIERAYTDAKAALAEQNEKAGGAGAKGWVYRTTGGAFGVDYPYRAAIAACCLGYNLPQDAVYPSLAVDSDGKPLDGDGRYVLHFDSGKLPPVNAFWSVTAYDKDGYFIKNRLDRQAIGDRSNLVSNADGSVDLYIQANSPGADKESNWLPVANAPFNLLMRLYWPSAAILDGGWAPPPVKRVD